MKDMGALDFVPIWGLFLCNLLLVVVSVEVGYRVGKFRHRRSEREKEAPVGAMVGATLGLLAFLLAFTFGLAAERFDRRRQTLLNEANAIGTTYLRADFLSDTQRDEVRKLLREYVDVRLDVARSGDISHAINRSQELHNVLWAEAAAAGKKNDGSIMTGLFVESLNDVIDLHSTRMMVSVRSRIPSTIWTVLYTVAILAFATMGYHGGLTETSRSLAILAVAFTFAAVMWLIADLDRPREGLLRIDQSAMVDLRASIDKPTP